jgi:hypothetical protein
MMSEKDMPQLISPVLLKAIGEVLGPSETLAEFIEAALVGSVARRQSMNNFVDRAIVSRDEARAKGGYVAAGDVLKELEIVLKEHSS